MSCSFALWRENVILARDTNLLNAIVKDIDLTARYDVLSAVYSERILPNDIDMTKEQSLTYDQLLSESYILPVNDMLPVLRIAAQQLSNEEQITFFAPLQKYVHNFVYH
jgi:hypothetical protein